MNPVVMSISYIQSCLKAAMLNLCISQTVSGQNVSASQGEDWGETNYLKQKSVKNKVIKIKHIKDKNMTRK